MKKMASTKTNTRYDGRPCGLLVSALLCVVGLGLLSRSYPLPGFLAEYTGDALYAVAVFLALAAVFRRSATRSLACSAFVFSAAVELSQLLTWPLLMDLRQTWLGALCLGQGFQWADLLAYLVGVGAVAALDRLVFRRHVLRA